ncbi:aldehyde dehydrogenase family protein [Amycolatopsis endophytica]|uniref:Aldehyde dehydrogenase n=1 Tax=Amycolatopsis endophytica TaxID=860233 RepID=A0A853B9C2_9PSEU|nr:aldehyde dehydrogenase family protein [Amycolatopsis endophytica]NYI91918.1 aldehyde dehydrogenase [Amycolatopsis endophytica]
MRYVPPGQPGSVVAVQSCYDNFAGGKWLAPTEGGYREVVAAATGRPLCRVADSTAADLEPALDAAHAVHAVWSESPPSSRAKVLAAAADAIEDNAEILAVAESWETGRPIREALGVDIPLAAGHFRYFAEVIGAEERTVPGIGDVLAYQFREPLGVVAQFLPVRFPVLLAAWNLAPALAAGNCSVVKPASASSWSVLKLAEVIGEVLPPGVVNVVTGRGEGVGRDLARSRRIAKVVFSGETGTGQRIPRYAARSLVPVALEVGSRSPSVFFDDVLADEDDFLDQAVDGIVVAASGEGLVCRCPSRALVHESVCDELVGRALERIAELVVDDPLDTATRVGPCGGAEQLAKVESCVDRGRQEGAGVLIGGHRVDVGDEFSGGFFYAPTVLRGHHRMRVFHDDLCGPVLAVTTFTDEEDAVALANTTPNGPGAGVWSRDGDRACRVGRAVKAGRVWTNCCHQYPAGTRHGCTPSTVVGRDAHRRVLDQYSRMKSLVVGHPRTGPRPLAG